MKSTVRRKNFYLDQKKLAQAQRILGKRTETETVDAALDLVLFRRRILRSLEQVAGKGGVEKVF